MDTTNDPTDQTTGPDDTTAQPDEGTVLFSFAADERLRSDPTLDGEIDREAARRFPGYPRPVVVSILIAEAAREAGPKWSNDHKHLVELTKGYQPPQKIAGEVRVLTGTKQLVARVSKDQYHGAPNTEGLTTSHLLRLGLTISAKKRPVLDPSVAVTATLLKGKRAR